MKRIILAGIVITCFIMLPVFVSASGFYLADQGGLTVGMGGQGTALAMDAHTVYFNPAGMTQLEGINVVCTATMFNFPTARMKRFADDFAIDDEDYYQNWIDTDGNYKWAELQNPTGFGGIFGGYAHNLSDVVDGLSVGFVANTVFGSALEYPEDPYAPNRYFMRNVQLVTVHFTPSIAYKILDWLSVGAGVSLVYAIVQMEMGMDPYTSIFEKYDDESDLYYENPSSPYYGKTEPLEMDDFMLNSTIAVLKANQQNINYCIDTLIDMDDITWTFNVALMLHFMDVFGEGDKLNYGFQYGYSVPLGVEGEVTMTMTDTFVALSQILIPGVTNVSKVDASLDIELPMYIRTGLAYTCPRGYITASVEYDWMQWSVYDEYKLEFAPNDLTSTLNMDTYTITKNWEDGWTIKFGVAIHLIPAIIETEAIEGFSLLVGTYYDKAVIPEEYLQLDYPAPGSVGLTFGFLFSITDWIGVDFGFLKYFFQPDITTIEVGESKQIPANEGIIDIDMMVMTLSVRLKF